MTRREHERALRRLAEGPQRISHLREAVGINHPLDFLDAIVAFGAPYHGTSEDEFARLPTVKREIILIRALYIYLGVKDLLGYFEEPRCGAHVSELKRGLRRIGASHTLKLIDDIEQQFLDNTVPEDEDVRRKAMKVFESKEWDDWFMGRILAYLETNEDVAERLREYVRAHHREIEAALRDGA